MAPPLGLPSNCLNPSATSTQESYLTDSLAVRLGGRAAEIIVLGEPSTGASNDLSGATDLASRMVRESGFLPKSDLLDTAPRVPTATIRLPVDPYPEETQRAIDQEVAEPLLGRRNEQPA